MVLDTLFQIAMTSTATLILNILIWKLNSEYYRALNAGRIMATKKLVTPTKISRENFKLLTDHQVKMTLMICNEKSVSEISRKFNISEKTFFNTRTNIFKKLGVKSSIALVKYVYKYKYLKF